MNTLSPRLAAALCFAGLLFPTAMPVMAQTPGTPAAAPSTQAMSSPAATVSVTIAGGTIDIRYSRPSMRGRKVMGGLVPFDQVWRTGANPATTLITSVPLRFGNLIVPAGNHTLYTLPSPNGWQLIINNQTGQWGTEYHQEQDLGRTPMQSKPVSSPQEVMSLSFENTTPSSTELHVRWENTDEYIVINKP